VALALAQGIVSKRRDAPYRSGRCPDWVKLKNPESAAARREAEEDWGRHRLGAAG
jgi:bifunctional non-homologous end joining protein LigD